MHFLLANASTISFREAMTLIALAGIGLLANQWPQEIFRRFRHKDPPPPTDLPEDP
jgi:hypothetical protein